MGLKQITRFFSKKAFKSGAELILYSNDGELKSNSKVYIGNKKIFVDGSADELVEDLKNMKSVLLVDLTCKNAKEYLSLLRAFWQDKKQCKNKIEQDKLKKLNTKLLEKVFLICNTPIEKTAIAEYLPVKNYFVPGVDGNTAQMFNRIKRLLPSNSRSKNQKLDSNN